MGSGFLADEDCKKQVQKIESYEKIHLVSSNIYRESSSFRQS